jgi:OmcA/MtrC family decaheme c-type cytochrome
VEITGATIESTGHVRVALRLTDGGAPVPTRDAAAALAPAFTLATLSVHPVDGLAAWKSLLLTGRQTAAQLPPGGPGTPPAQVLPNARQPGSESDGTLAGSDGAFTYVFANALPAGFDPAQTLRVGVLLQGVGTAEATSTFDFRPAGGAAAPRDTVADANCQTCHAHVRSEHGGVGVRMCLTCHTWQNSDPDTVDPAAMDGATAATDPNPLDFGRMVHRIHRGKNLPTLYRSSSALAAPALPSATALPLPFFPGRNAAIVGRKYAIVGADSREQVFGRIVSRRENGLEPITLAEGTVFPRGLRDCAVCHEGAPQEHEVLFGISRRTCSGCHPEAWFEPSSISDEVHFAHPGGPQTDDTQCSGCHVAATAAQPKVYAPILEIHVPPHRSPRFDRPVVEIVGVENLRAGGAPTVKFKAYDRIGPLSPIGPYPAPAPVPGGSVLPRTMHYAAGGWFGISIAGPTAPAFGQDYVLSEQAGNPSLFSLTADASGVFTYPFASTIPAGASGTWAVGIEARRAAATTHYDVASDTFLWPYTGETLTEPPWNPVVYVDTATGTFTAGVADAAVPRRKIVAQEKCDRCHDPIPVHGMTRMRVEYCVLCHGPDRTDWGVRPGVSAHPGVPVTGIVNLGATLDGIEERSIDFKVLIHRIHTGGRRGVASLEGIEPLVVYGRYGSKFFFDEALFPGDLANCTLCHEGKSYTVEAVPADAPPTRANETPTILHAPGTVAHPANEPSTPPIQAACLGCHASGATQDHARRKTVGGVEQCAQCHVRGDLSVEVAHGLAPSGASGVSATWSSIAQEILVPRCASASCHGGPPENYPALDAATGWAALVEAPSEQAGGMTLVEPYAPEASYLLLKIRGEGASVGGIGTPMPIQDAALTPSEIAAIEAWIANGAQND